VVFERMLGAVRHVPLLDALQFGQGHFRSPGNGAGTGPCQFNLVRAAAQSNRRRGNDRNSGESLWPFGHQLRWNSSSFDSALWLSRLALIETS
jgi:hypothetical protein